MKEFKKVIDFIPEEGSTGLNLYFTLQGEKGAVTFTVWTRWKEGLTNSYLSTTLIEQPMATDVGYHSRTRNDYGVEMGSCPHLDGDDCWYDGSTLQATEVFKILLKDGSDGVWKELERRYKEWFGND